MKLNQIAPPKGARKAPKRLGRGHGSGRGKTAGRGTKGQKSRSGGNLPPWFEGGQTPLHMRLPKKRGFTNIFKKQFSVVNVGKLGKFEADSEVTPAALKEKGLTKSEVLPVKILGGGALSVPLTVKAHAFSKSALDKITSAGGRVEELT